MDESVVVSLTDSQAMYTIVDKYHRLDSVKNRQSVTIQYRQDKCLESEKMTSKMTRNRHLTSDSEKLALSRPYGPVRTPDRL
jgi:hypothetical protein